MIILFVAAILACYAIAKGHLLATIVIFIVYAIAHETYDRWVLAQLRAQKTCKDCHHYINGACPRHAGFCFEHQQMLKHLKQCSKLKLKGE